MVLKNTSVYNEILADVITTLGSTCKCHRYQQRDMLQHGMDTLPPGTQVPIGPQHEEAADATLSLLTRFIVHSH